MNLGARTTYFRVMTFGKEWASGFAADEEWVRECLIIGLYMRLMLLLECIELAMCIGKVAIQIGHLHSQALVLCP